MRSKVMEYKRYSLHLSIST